MYNNSQKCPARQRRSVEIPARSTHDNSSQNYRLSYVSPNQLIPKKQVKNLRYTFSAKTLKYFDIVQIKEQNQQIQDKKNSFQNLRLAVLQLANKLNLANSQMFNKKKYNQNNSSHSNNSMKLLKNKPKSSASFRKNPPSSSFHSIGYTQALKPHTYCDQVHQPKQFDFYRQTFFNINNNEQLRESISTLQTNSFKPQFNQKPITKISQYITSEPMPENFDPAIQNSYSYISEDKNLYYLNQIIRALNQKNSLALQHINASIKMIKFCILQRQKFEPYEHKLYGSVDFKQMFKMQRLDKDRNKKTLVLDLDETLIHCYEDVSIPTDIKLKIDIEDERIQVGVNIRPYALSFLKRMAKKFEIVIFTASHQDYANLILDELDPDNQYFSHRFYRQHCVVLSNQLHVKDLSYLPRDLKNVILVDNAAYSYSFQLSNGIPILPYYEGKDFELIALERYLERLLEVQDVREVNLKYFKLNQYTQFQTGQQLINQVYINPSRRYYPK